MFGCILTPPTMPEADAGVIFMDNYACLNMCGHATIGVGTALVETGMVEVKEPVTRLVLDSPAGLVEVFVHVEGGRAHSVRFRNVPAFVEHLDGQVHVEGVGEVSVDVAFGGNYFAFASADALGVSIDPLKCGLLKDLGMRIKAAVNSQLVVKHPTKDYIKTVDIVTLYGQPTKTGARYKNVHIFSEAQADRSPGGTGTTAMAARLLERNEIAVGEEFVAEGLVGGLFRGKVLGRRDLGGRKAVDVEVSGSAWVTGMESVLVNREDALGAGFIVQ